MTNLWTPPQPYNSVSSTPAAMRTVLVCDVVESMLWMRQNETAAVAQWQAFVAEVKRTVLPRYGARLVKSLGDGLMLEFDVITSPAATPRAAVQAAHALHQLAHGLQGTPTAATSTSATLTPTDFPPFNLRIGLHHTAVTIGEDDIYGHGVNLCARIAGLAGPGETIISSDMRDQLTDQLDADIEDMGECYLKHVDEPVRVYRAGKASHQPILVPEPEYNTPLQATIAVIPFAARSLAQDNQLAVGEIIADAVIGQLSRTQDLKVISRLSTSVFRNAVQGGQTNNVAGIESHLGANYVLSGSYIAHDKKLIVTAELAKTKTNQVVWMDRIEGEIGDILQLQSELCNRIANEAHQAILDTEVQAAINQPLPTLESYSLLLAGISMIFKTTKADFQKCELMLKNLIDRHFGSSQAPSWLAKWHVMQKAQGWCLLDDATTLHQAQQLSNKSLSLASDSSFALAVDGLVKYNLAFDFEGALVQFEAAIRINPNESLAWLYKGMLHAFRGQGEEAVQDTLHALALSPMDPNVHYYNSLVASAHLSAGRYLGAVDFAKRALRGNILHVSTHRCLVIALALGGCEQEAKSCALNLMRIAPHLTVSGYLSNFSNSKFLLGKKFAEALRIAGVPA